MGKRDDFQKDLSHKVLGTINKFNLINENDKIVVGVSGGPDSICLLHILNELKSKLNFKLYVAHINHMIREEAEEETQYVQDFCKNLGVECFVKRVDVIAKSNNEKIGTEEAGRKARYDFFEEVLEKVGANKIATAHNSNDNAETVLMNIIRGSGTSGLKGIEPIRDNKFIRPIIECERFEIEEYCSNYKLNPKIDKSNFENVYTRNKIRNILIPEIKEEFNPNIIKALNKLAIVAREESTYIQNIADKELSNNLIISKDMEKQVIELDLKKFNALDNVIKSRVVLSAIKFVQGNVQGIEKIHIDDIIRLCEKNIGNKFLTPNQFIKVEVKEGKVTFSKKQIKRKSLGNNMFE